MGNLPGNTAHPALTARLERVLSADRPLLAQRIAALVRLAPPERALAERELGSAIDASASRRSARAASLPTPRFDQPLPVLERRREIADAIASHQVVVLCGATGSGKTTQLPQICLSLGRGAAGLIAHTQPRRLAARAVATRIAEELGVPLGGAVGVKVRFDDRTSPQTVVKLMTDGMLLAETAGDPELSAYDTIIIDEAHERSLNIDFLLGYLHRLLPRRPDLKLIITSATIDPQRFSAHFAGVLAAPVIEVSGRTYPVEIRSHALDDDEDTSDQVEASAVVDAVFELSSSRLPRGDILVFLPGEREIRLCADALRRSAGGLEILPLYSRLSSAEQDRIFHPSPLAGAPRRVILATNVAETSLTVPGIRYVVDTGLARISRYDPRARVQRLPIEPISQASAEQRSGRCGRTAEGVCIRLFSERSFAARPRFTEPEVRRSSLAAVILQMKALNLGPIEDFPFLDRPDARAVKDGYETLFELGALERAEADAPVTRIGRQLARLPVDPRVGRMLIAAGSDDPDTGGTLREVLVLAAALSIQDPRQRPMERADAADAAHAVFLSPRSDFLTLLNIWDQQRHAIDNMSAGEYHDWCRRHFLAPARLREWSDMHRQLADAADMLDLRFNERPSEPDAVHRAMLTGLISNLACREDAAGREYRGARGNVLSIFPGSVLFKKHPKWIMAAEFVETSRLFARTIASIEPEWIERLAPHVLHVQRDGEHFDKDTGAPSAWERVTLNGLVVVPRRRVALAGADTAASRRMFIRKALCAGEVAGDSPFARHTRDAFAKARAASGKLRRRDLLASEDILAEWFDSALPQSVHDQGTLDRALERLTPDELRPLLIPEHVLLSDSARAAADERLFPVSLLLADHDEIITCPLEYRFEPGKESDGITLQVPIAHLPALSADAAAWLVPGLLPEKIHALLKQLPKQHRQALDAAPLADLARELAELVAPTRGTLPAQLSEALAVVGDLIVPPGAWPLGAVPDHLRLRVRVVDAEGKAIGEDRDLAQLQTRLDARVRKARAASTRARFEQTGLTSWTFGPLPDTVDSPDGPAHPMLVDAGTSVTLTLTHDAALAAANTPRGVRRFAALACRDELAHRIDALANWHDLVRWHQQLGSADELRDAITCLVVERVMLAGQPAVRDRAAFEARLQEAWGRLGQATIETGASVAGILEPRARVAQRLSGGTPRLWAASIADIREHAAYLMPRAFLFHLSPQLLRAYPAYASAMRERLLTLREDGSGSETAVLARFSPYWKRFTAWVSQRMSVIRADSEAAGEPDAARGSRAGAKAGKAPLPQTRRQSPAVNVDAGEWAMRPGSLPGPIAAYRWALEDARAKLFGELPERGESTEAQYRRLDELWRAAEPADDKRRR